MQNSVLFYRITVESSVIFFPSLTNSLSSHVPFLRLGPRKGSYPYQSHEAVGRVVSKFAQVLLVLAIWITYAKNNMKTSTGLEPLFMCGSLLPLLP